MNADLSVAPEIAQLAAPFAPPPHDRDSAAPRTDGRQFALRGSGSAIDGLRALAAAAWQAGEDLTRDQVAAALKELAAAGLPT